MLEQEQGREITLQGGFFCCRLGLGWADFGAPGQTVQVYPMSFHDPPWTPLSCLGQVRHYRVPMRPCQSQKQHHIGGEEPRCPVSSTVSTLCVWFHSPTCPHASSPTSFPCASNWARGLEVLGSLGFFRPVLIFSLFLSLPPLRQQIRCGASRRLALPLSKVGPGFDDVPVNRKELT